MGSWVMSWSVAGWWYDVMYQVDDGTYSVQNIMSHYIVELNRLACSVCLKTILWLIFKKKHTHIYPTQHTIVDASICVIVFSVTRLFCWHNGVLFRYFPANLLMMISSYAFIAENMQPKWVSLLRSLYLFERPETDKCNQQQLWLFLPNFYRTANVILLRSCGLSIDIKLSFPFKWSLEFCWTFCCCTEMLQQTNRKQINKKYVQLVWVGN